MRPILRAINLSKKYLVGSSVIRAVANVSLTVQAGEFIAIVGRSGSGKSTLMSLLGLLEKPDSGDFILNGQSTVKLPEDTTAEIRSRQIGFVFQLPALLARATALENTELPLAYSDVPRAEAKRRAQNALEKVGLGHRLSHWPHQLSGGEQQRVAIARALVNDPAVILADEPTGALDSKTGDAILSLFKELNRDGRTIIVVTHAMEVAQTAARRVTLHDGRVTHDDANMIEPTDL
jgi:putative ABC transport system ATP-binding protein